MSKKTCPRCGSRDMEFPALSRSDNKTEVCSDCGQWEALYQFMNRGKLPPIEKGRPIERPYDGESW